jgi:hypothetical protein
MDNSTSRISEANRAQTHHLDQLNKCWVEAEERLRTLNVGHDLVVHHRYEETDHPSPVAAEFECKLGFRKLAKGWCICYGIGPTMLEWWEHPWGWTPILECSQDVRKQAAHLMKSLIQEAEAAAERSRQEAAEASAAIQEALGGLRPGPSLDERFQRLVSQWKEETKYLSSITDMAMHPAYQEIIGMGPAVLPHLFRELEKQPDHWFWALKMITGADPVPDASRGNVPAMTAAWLHWAREHGYLGKP